MQGIELPKYDHFCDKCRHLGTTIYDKRTFDLYYHPGKTNLDRQYKAVYGHGEDNLMAIPDMMIRAMANNTETSDYPPVQAYKLAIKLKFIQG